MAFNWLDVLLALMIFPAVIIGLIKGLIRELIGILVVIFGVAAATRYFQPMTIFLSRFISNAPVAKMVSFFFVFVIILVVGAILSRLCAKLIKGGISLANHLLGGFLGLIEGTILAGGILFALLLAIPGNSEVLKNSQLKPYVFNVTMSLVRFIPKDLKAQIKKNYESISSKGRGHG